MSNTNQPNHRGFLIHPGMTYEDYQAGLERFAAEAKRQERRLKLQRKIDREQKR